MKNMQKIESDCYYIIERLKEIDPSYELYFCRDHYEVHSFLQEKDSYCFTVPYPVLDARTIEFALKTRSANRDAIIAEIEENNRLLEEKNIKNQVNLIKEGLCL